MANEGEPFEDILGHVVEHELRRARLRLPRSDPSMDRSAALKSEDAGRGGHAASLPCPPRMRKRLPGAPDRGSMAR